MLIMYWPRSSHGFVTVTVQIVISEMHHLLDTNCISDDRGISWLCVWVWLCELSVMLFWKWRNDSGLAPSSIGRWSWSSRLWAATTLNERSLLLRPHEEATCHTAQTSTRDWHLPPWMGLTSTPLGWFVTDAESQGLRCDRYEKRGDCNKDSPCVVSSIKEL
jgi:hypothetical protein